MPPPTQYRHSWIAPKWLKSPVAMRVIWAFLRPLDRIMNVMIEGASASFPGIGTPTALAAIGQSRGIPQGPNEPSDLYIARLLGWLTTWGNAGSDLELARQIQGFLTGAGTLGARVKPTVRIVHRNYQWTVINPDGTFNFSQAAWSWDASTGYDDGHQAQPGVVASGYWSDTWIVIAPDPFPRYASTSDATWIANFGNKQGLGLGHQVPRAVVDGILSIASAIAFKPPHTWLRAIVWTGDTSSFSPGTPTADGTFGNASQLVAGVQTPARASSARYWEPANG